MAEKKGKNKLAARARRERRTRSKIHGTAARPRLSIYRSLANIFAQVIDDEQGRTLASVQWTEDALKSLKPMEQATEAGKLLASRAKDAGIDSAVFDRGGYIYTGRVAELAAGAREGGLDF